jgi:hypothetical protein
MEQNEQDYLGTLKTHLDKELEQVRSHAKWYKESATKNKRRYYLFRIPVIVLGIVLPILVTIQSGGKALDLSSVFTIAISLLISILTSLDTFFQYGKSWADERTAELAMYKLLRKYDREKLKINSPVNIKASIEIAEKVLLLLQQEYEEIVGETVDAFMRRSKEMEANRQNVDLPK